MTTSPITLRRLSTSDLSFAMRLKESAGWNQTEDDWRFFLEAHTSECFLALYDEHLAGTAVALEYGPSLGWVGMVLVDPDFRRRGIGRTLLERVLTTLGHCKRIGLDATPQGSQLYRTLGFEVVGHLARYVLDTTSVAPALDAPEDHQLTISRARGSVTNICDYDEAVSGLRRSAVLVNWAQRTPELALVAQRDAAICGYMMGRAGSRYDHIGPVVADDQGVAEQLLTVALGRMARRRQVALDAVERSAWTVFLRALGFRQERSFLRMSRRGSLPPRTQQSLSPEEMDLTAAPLWASAGPEVG